MKLKKLILIDENGIREEIGIRKIKRWAREGNLFSLVVLDEDNQN